MNTEIIVHPKLHHYGLITANLNDMIDWYQKVLGMTINQREDSSDRTARAARAAILGVCVRQQRRDGSSHRFL